MLAHKVEEERGHKAAIVWNKEFLLSLNISGLSHNCKKSRTGTAECNVIVLIPFVYFPVLESASVRSGTLHSVDW